MLGDIFLKEDLKRYISTDEEYEYIKDDKSFFEIWTNKEALSKCIGIGLTKKVKEIPVVTWILAVIFFADIIFEACK